jgi:ectoine hydroxylase-related dioxygenase (phytanoyl-CoA dioxygenase family)
MYINPILASLRNRVLEGEKQSTFSWNEELEELYKNGLAIDEVLQYLYFKKPTLEEFIAWVNRDDLKNLSKDITLEKENNSEVFSKSELQFFETNGYIVLKRAISEADCLATQKIIWDFLEMDPTDSATWYKSHPMQRGLMVNFFNDLVLEKNRNSIRIKKAYEQLYQSTKIYKTIDKVSFNPPVTSQYTFKGSSLHWDVSLQLPIPFRLQGLIYLSDCGSNDGAFHCVPGFHKVIEEWLSRVPNDCPPREYALQTLKPVPVVGRAGDMVIWDQVLPHCATPNNGSKPRMVQYLSYFKEDYKDQEKWI